MQKSDVPMIKDHAIRMGVSKKATLSQSDVTVLGNSIARDNEALGNEIVTMHCHDVEDMLVNLVFGD